MCIARRGGGGIRGPEALCRAHGSTEASAALSICRERGDRNGECHVLGNLGTVDAAVGRMDEACAHFDEALAVSVEVGNRVNAGFTLTNLGILHRSQGRMDQARTYSDAALAIAREVGNRHLECAVLANLGVIHKVQGRIEEAHGDLHRALSVARDSRDRRSEAQVQSDLANLHRDQGQLDDAHAYYDVALTLARQLNNPMLVGGLLGGLAELLRLEGKPDEARGPLAEGERMLREAAGSSGELVAVLCTRARLEWAQGAPAAARASLAEAEAVARRLGRSRRVSLGRIWSGRARCWTGRRRSGLCLNTTEQDPLSERGETKALLKPTEPRMPSIAQIVTSMTALVADQAPGLLDALNRGPAPDGQIAALQQAVGVALPQDLLAFLCMHGRGDGFVLSEAADYRSLGAEGIRLAWADRCDQPSWRRSWIPIAQDGGGNLLCLDLDPPADQTRGQLFFWERIGAAQPPIRPNLTDHLRHVLARWQAHGVLYQADSGLLELARAQAPAPVEHLTITPPMASEDAVTWIRLVDGFIDAEVKAKRLDYLTLPPHLHTVCYYKLLTYYLDNGGLATYVEKAGDYHSQVRQFLEAIGDAAVGPILERAFAASDASSLDGDMQVARSELLRRTATAISARIGLLFDDQRFVYRALQAPEGTWFAELALAAGYPIDRPVAREQTLLGMAIGSMVRNYDCARMLLARGANPMCHFRGWTPAHSAPLALEAVQLVVDAGADINPIGRQGETPLQVMLNNLPARTDPAVVEALLGAGADLHVYDDFFRSPLHAAAAKGMVDLVRRCLDAGLDPNQPSRLSTAHYLPLYGALVEGHLDVVQLLLERGADPDAVDGYGWSGLHNAVVKGDLPAVNALVAAGADRDLASQKKRKARKLTFAKGASPRDCAAQLGDAAMQAALAQRTR